MTHQQLQQLLQRYQTGECTPEERQAVERWYAALNHPEPQLTTPERDTLQAALWERIASQTVPPAQPATAPAGSMQGAPWLRWAAAAVVVLGSGLGVLWWRAQPADLVRQTPTAAPAVAWVQYPNATARPVDVRLADGSVVTLAPASQLRYPRQFQGPRRQVFLRGEAFFKVAHNPARPFQVYTAKVVTTVLGTSFRVRAFDNQPEASVQVRTGRVRVSPRAAAADKAAALPAAVVLTPNQQTTYRPGVALKTELVAQPALLTPAQSFTFDDRPVPEVLAALEQAYGVDIVYDEAALASCSVRLTLRDPSLYGKLAVLGKTLGGSYQLDGTRIRFKAKGCQQ